MIVKCAPQLRKLGLTNGLPEIEPLNARTEI